MIASSGQRGCVDAARGQLGIYLESGLLWMPPTGRMKSRDGARCGVWSRWGDGVPRSDNGAI